MDKHGVYIYIIYTPFLGWLRDGYTTHGKPSQNMALHFVVDQWIDQLKTVQS
jgi:hypothetical protein